MSGTMNARAQTFARRVLFLSEPDEGRDAASLSLSELAFGFCGYDECEDIVMDRERACRRHARAMVLGASKMIVEGDLHTELSGAGVLFVRLSPKGVLAPLGWSSVPKWMAERPGLVRWAEGKVAARRWEEMV